MARGARQSSKSGFRVITGPVSKTFPSRVRVEPGELALTAAAIADEKHASAVVVIDIREISPFCSYFVIATAANARLMDTVASESLLRIKETFGLSGTIEGAGSEEWRLIDYGSVAIHLFSPDGRRFYQIEKLWSDAPRVENAPRGGQAEAVTA